MIEAIAERMDWKTDLYRKVAPHLAEHAIFASNTSGLSINYAGAGVPGSAAAALLRHAFLQPAALHASGRADRARRDTDPAILDELETFLVTTLGKGVVRAKDTPNFIANRVGVFSMLATMHHAEQFGLGFDVVDALTGPRDRPREERHVPHRRRGRPRHDGARHQDHGGHAAGRSVARVLRGARLAAAAGRRRARSGRRPRRGFYKKVGKDIQVLDLATGRLPPVGGRGRRARSSRS